MRVMNINGWTWRPVNEHGEDIDETVTPFCGKEGSK
jgi:hypothetical protein